MFNGSMVSMLQFCNFFTYEFSLILMTSMSHSQIKVYGKLIFTSHPHNVISDDNISSG